MHGGRLVARRLAAHGVTKLFTLSGGHLFSVYDGCREEGIDIVDVRHESAAAFAAEGWAKVTREPGVCALTAGPGVTNGMSALGSALRTTRRCSCSAGARPRCAGARARCRRSTTCRSCGRSRASPRRPARRRRSPRSSTRRGPPPCAPHSGPAFVDLPLDHVFMEAEGGEEPAPRRARAGRRPTSRARSRCSSEAERPVIMAGTDLYWGRGEVALRELVEARRHPRLPQRPRARVHPGRPRAVLLARALDRAQGRRRRARRRRADGLPARLRQVVRRGHGDRRDRRRRARARAPARGRRGALRRPRRDPLGPGRRARDRTPASGSSRSRRSSARSGRPSASCARTRARRCTRCASTRSSATCSTATRS